MNIKDQLENIRQANRKEFTSKKSSLLPYIPTKKEKTEKETIQAKVTPWATSIDLETTSLQGNFMAIIMCGVVKPWGQPCQVFRGDHYDTWDYKRADDTQITTDIYTAMLDASVWIAHNGLNYDINYLRTRLSAPDLHVKMPQPKNFDPVRIARRYFRLNFNSLKEVARHLGYEGKTEVPPRVWNEAAFNGSRLALDYIVEHCIADVILLEKVANDLKYLAPKITQGGSDI